MRWKAAFGAMARTAATLVLSPGFIAVLLLATAAACAVIGVEMLVGRAWALIAASVIGFALAGFLLRGMSRE